VTRRAARFLTRLYPTGWRARYGEEFQTFLESRRVLFREILNILGSALSERLAGFLTIVLYACPATVAAGGAIYLTASGAPVVQAFEAHRALWLCWAIIEASALAIAAAGVVAVAPAVFRILRKPSRKVLWELAWVVGAGLLLVMWLSLMWLADDADNERSAVAMFMAFGLGMFAESVARFLKYVIAHSDLSQSLGRAKLAVLAMAESILVVTVTAGGCGLLSKPSAHGLPLWPYVFWIVVASSLVFSAAPGIRSARRLRSDAQ
jgi:acyl-CoA synthetase (AMP-forming)/AMP-acid ligase II